MSIGSNDPTYAASGDVAGWQYRVEGEGETEREFLVYVQRDDGPRILTLACERDIDTFGFFAEDLGDLVGPLARATMTLSSGPAKMTLPGVVEPDPETNALGFVTQVPQSNGGQQQLMAVLRPMLTLGQPIHMAFGNKARDLPPVTGLPDPAETVPAGLLRRVTAVRRRTRARLLPCRAGSGKVPRGFLIRTCTKTKS